MEVNRSLPFSNASSFMILKSNLPCEFRGTPPMSINLSFICVSRESLAGCPLVNINPVFAIWQFRQNTQVSEIIGK